MIALSQRDTSRRKSRNHRQPARANRQALLQGFCSLHNPLPSVGVLHDTCYCNHTCGIYILVHISLKYMRNDISGHFCSNYGRYPARSIDADKTSRLKLYKNSYLSGIIGFVSSGVSVSTRLPEETGQPSGERTFCPPNPRLFCGLCFKKCVQIDPICPARRP